MAAMKLKHPNAYVKKSSSLHDLPVIQVELAKRTGVTQACVSRILTGRQSVQLWWLLKVSSLYDISMDELCDGLVVR